MSEGDAKAKISRKEAMRLGLETFFTGRKCKNGNIAERYVSTRICVCQQCKDDSLEGKKRWYAKNKNAACEYQRGYRENNLERVLATQKKYYENDRKFHCERVRLYLEKNPETRARYLEKNKEKIQKARQRRAKANPQLNRLQVALRRATRQQRIPKWFGEIDRFIIEEAADLASLRERATGIKWHVDHMIPLRAKLASGLHCGDNLQVIPEVMNLRKHNKLWLTQPGEWIRHI